MKKVMLKTTISLAVAMASTQLFASGFAPVSYTHLTLPTKA